MKKIIIISLIGILFIGAFLYLYKINEKDNPQTNLKQTSPTVLPTTDISTDTAKNTILVRNASGKSLTVHNFLSDVDTVVDKQNDGYYYLGKHFPLDGTPTVKNPEYVIEYISETNYFNIGLFSEPIVQSRHNAEQYLLQHLGVTEAQLCLLNYMVSVPYWVNKYFTGQSLGFSFCSGSVKLE